MSNTLCYFSVVILHTNITDTENIIDTDLKRGLLFITLFKV